MIPSTMMAVERVVKMPQEEIVAVAPRTAKRIEIQKVYLGAGNLK
jgi:hypothetical protein